MKCKDCGSSDVMVLATRRTGDGLLRRRRQCKDCGARFSTIEVPLKLRRKRAEAIPAEGATTPPAPILDDH